MIPTPHISLVGAGPGDPDLLTIKGMRALQQADVVLFDALANESLLQYASQAKVIQYVGKRGGIKSHSQEEIHQLMITMAQMHGHVVRLKGGDPMIFGRGFEELKAASEHGIPCTVVPGISSAFALTELLHFPLTHRLLSRSIMVMTATCQDRKLNPEVIESASNGSTKVILMGISKLGTIAQTYIRLGLGNTSAAVIQNGSKLNQKAVFGTMKDIYQKAVDKNIGTPGIIVIGPVVELRKQIIEHGQEPLVSRISQSA